MGIVYRYSVSNVDNQLVMFRSAIDLGGLGNPVLSGYSDASFTRDIDTCRSTSGFIFILAGAPSLGKVVRRLLLLYRVQRLNILL